jgi:hypothetical protein
VTQEDPTTEKLVSMMDELRARAGSPDMSRVVQNESLLGRLKCELMYGGNRGYDGIVAIHCIVCNWIDWVWRGPIPMQAMLNPNDTACPICGGGVMLCVAKKKPVEVMP